MGHILNNHKKNGKIKVEIVQLNRYCSPSEIIIENVQGNNILYIRKLYLIYKVFILIKIENVLHIRQCLLPNKKESLIKCQEEKDL